MTHSPSWVELISFSPLWRRRASMASSAPSNASALTGRLRRAIIIEPLSLARSKSVRRPSRLTMAGSSISARS
jgi:hypothetical protein